MPSWVRALAATLPRTTACMLEADSLHRTRSPLPPVLRARLRWEAAHACRCQYSEAVAEDDLRRAGLAEADIRKLADPGEERPLAERAALTFAHKLARDASTVTDHEVAQLIGFYGEKQVVAMVLLLAHSSFQDHLFLALGLAPEPGGVPAPVAIRFAPSLPGEAPRPPRRTMPTQEPAVPPAELVPGWRKTDFACLQHGLDEQRGRRPRIPLPAAGAEGNRWGLVCRTYQPELAAAWSACTRAFEAEADLDPVLSGSLFWVVTRSLGCFY